MESRVAKVDPVAEWLIWTARDAGDPVTNLWVQKLVYYAQAWYAALNEDKALFPERIEAWVHGPVCPALYARLKDYKWSPITEELEKPELDDDVEGHLREVMEAYGGFNAFELERMTHNEKPWLDARRGCAPDDYCNREIPVPAMGAFYRSRLDE